MAKKKSLQKLTDFNKIESVKQAEEFVSENPKLKKELWRNISKRVSETYAEQLGNDYELIEILISLTDNEELIEDIRNSTYEANQLVISGYIHNHLCDNRTFPSITKIQQETKLSRQTIYNHLNSGLNTKYNKLIQGKNEIMITKALEKLYLIGIEDNNATALKHFIELNTSVNKYANTQVNNYIQINNLKISKEEFRNLPSETILEVEEILSKSINDLNKT